MSTSPHQLFLLADHVKLSLLERQRAMALNIQGTQQDGHITRNLEALRQGIESLQSQAEEQESIGGDVSDLNEQLSRLQSQCADLSSQFHGSPAAAASSTLTNPNDPSLAADFSAATSKSVRFRDASSAPYRDNDQDAHEEGNAAALFPSTYRDEPAPPDQSELNNQQIHAYHKQVLQEQDDQLETLGQSIGRQRMLGIHMGDELDGQNAMLDDVERGVDRFQSNLDRARGRLGKVARKAKDNWNWVTIAILIIILVLLLILLK